MIYVDTDHALFDIAAGWRFYVDELILYVSHKLACIDLLEVGDQRLDRVRIWPLEFH